MENKYVMEYSSKLFTQEDIELIQWIRKRYTDLSRCELASTVCEFLDWTTDDGRPKTVICNKFLEKLEFEGLLTHPVLQTEMIRSGKGSFTQIQTPEVKITGNLAEYDRIRLVIVETTEEMKLFRSYIEKYHMLGYKRAYGSRLFNFIVRGDEKFGCLQFSASSWPLKKEAVGLDGQRGTVKNVCI